MTDDLTKRGEPDRSLVALNEPWEVEYWTNKLGVDPGELQAIIQRVGNSVDKVEAEVAQVKAHGSPSINPADSGETPSGNGQ